MSFMLRCRRDWTGRRTSPRTFVIRTIATLVIQMLLLFSHQHYIIIRTFINTRFPGNMVGPQVAFLLLAAAFARNFWRSRPLWERCPSLCVRYRPLWMGCRVLFAFDHAAVNCLSLLTVWPVQLRYPLCHFVNVLRAKVVHNPNYILIMKAAQSIQPRYFCNQMVPKETDIFLAIYIYTIDMYTQIYPKQWLINTIP